MYFTQSDITDMQARERAEDQAVAEFKMNRDAAYNRRTLGALRRTPVRVQTLPVDFTPQDPGYREDHDIDGYDYEQEARRFQAEAEELLPPMSVTVFFNEATDTQGRPVGMLDGYSSEHPIRPVFRYRAAEGITEEHVFETCNAGEDDTARTYRAAGNRSLSVGDVVAITDTRTGWTSWKSVARFGWTAVTCAPEFLDWNPVQREFSQF